MSDTQKMLQVAYSQEYNITSQQIEEETFKTSCSMIFKFAVKIHLVL